MENVSHNTSWSINDHLDDEVPKYDKFEFEITKQMESPEFKSFDSKPGNIRGLDINPMPISYGGHPVVQSSSNSNTLQFQSALFNGHQAQSKSSNSRSNTM
jgi:hypothetical protein